MKIVIDSAIPYIHGVWEPHAEVVYLSGDQISAEDVRNADALIVRTRTRCNEALLAGSSVRIVATATIGTDHIDLAWCAANGIRVESAAGCKARTLPEELFNVFHKLFSCFIMYLPSRFSTLATMNDNLQ